MPPRGGIGSPCGSQLCSTCKVEVNLEKAQELVDMVKKIHSMFWATKGRDVTFYTAS